MGLLDIIFGKSEPRQLVNDTRTQILQSIDFHTKKQHEILEREFNASSQAVRGFSDGWNNLVVGKSGFFKRDITFAGTIMTITLDFPKSVQINRVTQNFNDATAKDFDIRIYEAPGNNYVSLNLKTGNINVSVLDLTDVKVPAFGRISIVYTNFTAGKTVQIAIQADEL